jgi:hypothetical protein
LLFFLEKAEIHAAVGNVAEKVWVVAEAVVLAVLENENTALFEHIALQYKVGNFGKPFFLAVVKEL